MPKENSDISVKKDNRTFGAILTENKAIFNYIYDSNGFRIGIAVATKGLGKHHPKIGWALFEEVPHIEVARERLMDIPNIGSELDLITAQFCDLVDSMGNIDEEEQGWMISNIGNSLAYLRDYSLKEDYSNIYEISPADKSAKIELLELALSRANFDSWNYYCDRNDKVLSNADLRNDYIAYNVCYDETEHEDVSYVSPDICRSIRNTIRELEHRAWRYYK